MIDNVSNHLHAQSSPEDIQAQNRRAIDQIAKGMESQFAKLLLNQMQDSIKRSQPQSSASKFYQEMLTDEYAKLMTDRKQGLGLQKLIRQQLYREHNIPTEQIAQNKFNDISMKKSRCNIDKYQKESNND